MKSPQWHLNQTSSYSHRWLWTFCSSILLMGSFAIGLPAAAKTESIPVSKPDVFKPDASEGERFVSVLQQSANFFTPHRFNQPQTHPVASFPSFNSQQLDQQLRRYAEFVATYGVPDVLIVGSSRSYQGIDPLVLQQSLAQKGYGDLKVFNFGINGATAQVVNWLLQELLPADHLPRLIVWGDGARAFNDGRIDLTYNKIITSRGHQLLSSGIRPDLPTVERFELTQICLNNWMPLLSSSLSSLKSLNQSFTEIPSKTSFCQQPLQALLQQAVIATLRPLQFNLTSETLGFRVVNTQFTPNAYFQRFARVPGRFDRDYSNFTLKGKQFDALAAVVRFANQHQVPLVFVNLPLTDIYLDRPRQDWEKQFQVRMQNLARSQDWTFIDLMNQQDLKQHRYFEDPSHINRYGAAAIAAWISKDLIPPLSVTRPAGHR